ncbi:M91 family zinc metallopeptidase [uncultured Paludibaculum sp.]|uniref:M91 family zinc metallopeptidase n=1 Tax=uncultured Paludibaculum sp. TaxID=1765020 RepID=UPI002AAACB32|nr:M91 family zinc metallopeptidase [uncultured Paludibaculum sp.]
MPFQYGSGILIKGCRRDGGKIAAMSGSKATEFIDATKGWLDALKRTATGARLLAEIDNTGHTVEIYRTWDITDGNYQGGDDPDLAMVKPFTTRNADGTTELQVVLDRASQDTSGRTKLQKFFGIGKAKPKFLKKEAIARLVGVTPSELAQMEGGTKTIPPVVDARLRSYLYHFLTPGKGCPCHVVFNHLRDNLSARHRTYLPMSHNWEHRPPGIALGHELIHAWRVVAGMVLFKYGWEEEAMTVGLPPFSFMEFTENKLRVEYGGLAIRPDYQNLMPETPLTTGLKLGVDRTDMSWQGKQSALHTQQHLAQALSARRRAMGYDEEDGF